MGRGLQAGRTPAKGPVSLATVKDPVLAAPARLRLSDRHPTAGPSTLAIAARGSDVAGDLLDSVRGPIVIH